MAGAGGGQSNSYSANPNDYKLQEEIGYGASAVVYRAIYIPLNQTVAVKCLDLDRSNINLDDISKEAQTMSLIHHPNVINAFCSFVVAHNLWVVMPFMAEGSCLHLMKTAYPEGFEESAIGSMLKETLKALDYLHRRGYIHRDVKAGNILMDTNGEVKLADFGVSASLFDRGDRQRSRNTFVGTPCWMAPEVLQPGPGYDSKADIWSFGITALELAHGHAPFSKYPPMKVLLMTIQNAPPGLDYDRDKRFSKSFKEMVAMCLVKDQTKRPTAEKLLKHSFFKHAKSPEFTVKKLFADLPPLWNRVKALQLKDAAQLALKKMPSSEQEAISHSEYQRGVSAWNFDVEDLKLQASLLIDGEEIQDDEACSKSYVSNKDTSSSENVAVKPISPKNVMRSGIEIPKVEGLIKKEKEVMESEGSKKNEYKLELLKALAATPRQTQTQSGPLNPGKVLTHSSSEKLRKIERSELENHIPEKIQHVRRAPSFSGPLMLPTRASSNSLSAPIKLTGGFRDSLDDKSKANIVQIKGRFSVTSENVDLVKDVPLSTPPQRSSQGSPMRKSASVGDSVYEARIMPSTNVQPTIKENNENISASILMPHLQNLLQQNSIQQELIMNLLNSMQLADVADASQNGKLPPLPRNSETNGTVELAVTERERLLLGKVYELQARMLTMTEELNNEKFKSAQLEQQLNLRSGREEYNYRS